MQDECYLVEGRDGVVILASTAFKNNINEWNDYIKLLNKLVAGKLLSYHPNGWNTYADAPVYATESALASWGKDGSVTALTSQFVKTFGERENESRMNKLSTVGHTGIHAWGNRVRRQFFGGGAVVVEPRIPRLQPWGVSRRNGIGARCWLC